MASADVIEMKDVIVLEDGECSNDNSDEPSPKRQKIDNDFKDFVIDTNVSITEDDDVVEVNIETKIEDVRSKSPSLLSTPSSWALSLQGGLLGEVTPDSKDGKKPKRRNGPVCFNCGGEHIIAKCEQPRDQARIRKATMEFRAKSQNVTARYHDTEEQSKYKPGRLSVNLREALDIGPDDIPEWIYRMRRMGFYKGYPPGYLKKALKEDNSNEVLTFHMTSSFPANKDGVTSPSSAKKQKRKRPAPVLDETKVMYYMGFNNTYRALRDREKFKVPPFNLYCEMLQREISDHHEEELKKDVVEVDQTKPEPIESTEDEMFVIDKTPNSENLPTIQSDDVEKDDEEKKAAEESSLDDSSMGDSVSMHVGTPVISRRHKDGSWGHQKLPELDKFAIGIVPFEAVEEHTGEKGIFKRIMGKIKQIVGGGGSEEKK